MKKLSRETKITRLCERLRGERSPTRIGTITEGSLEIQINRGDKLNYTRLAFIVDRWDDLSWQDKTWRIKFAQFMNYESPWPLGWYSKQPYTRKETTL